MLEEQQRQQRAEAGRRQPGQNRDRVDEALVEDAEHDVDDEDRECTGPSRAREASPGTPARCPGSCPTRCRAASRARAARPAATASPSATPGCDVERERHRRQLADVIDRLSGPTLCAGRRRPPTAAPACRSGACTYSIDSAAGSCWYCGATCMITWYWSFGREDRATPAATRRPMTAPTPPDRPSARARRSARDRASRSAAGS